MVRVIMLTCPSCGVRLKYTGGERLVHCEYCNGTFPVENELNDRIKRAFQLIAQSNYAQARDVLEEAAVIDPQNGRIFFAMLLCDLSVNSPSKLAKAGRDFTRMPNYQNAITYLDQESKGELEQLAQMNKQYMGSASAPSSYPTEAMKEFNKANTYTLNGRTTSLFTILHICIDKPFETKKATYVPIMAQIEKAIDLYTKLTPDEKQNLSFFDNDAAKAAVADFAKFKEELSAYNVRMEEQARLEAEEAARRAEERRNNPGYNWLDHIADSDDEEEEEEEVVAPKKVERKSAPRTKANLVIETNNYTQLVAICVSTRVSRVDNCSRITVDCYVDDNGNYVNGEGFPIYIEGRDRILTIKSASKHGQSVSNNSLGSSNMVVSGQNYSNIGSNNVYVGDGRNMSNNNNMSGRVIGGINGFNPQATNEVSVVINGKKYRGNFTY